MSELWKVWNLDSSDTAARSYAAGQFDEDGEVVVTRGRAILRVRVGASKEQVPVLGNLPARRIGDVTLLTGIGARTFLEYVVPFLACKREQVDYALAQWYERKNAELEYKRMVENSASRMPGTTC